MRGIGFHLKMPSTTSLYVCLRGWWRRTMMKNWWYNVPTHTLYPISKPHVVVMVIQTTMMFWLLHEYIYILWVVCDLGIVVLVSNSLEYWNSLNSCQLLGSWTPLQVVGKGIMRAKVLIEFNLKVASSCCDKKKGSVVLFFAHTPWLGLYNKHTTHLHYHSTL